MQAKDKVTKESKAAKGKTRSSKRGGVKKEDSEPEDEETTMITPRRSGRVKGEVNMCACMLQFSCVSPF